MTSQQGVLSLLFKLGRDAKPAKNTGMTDTDYQSLYIRSDQGILFIIHAGDEFLKNNHWPASCHETSSCWGT